jgi:hypothetical protein
MAGVGGVVVPTRSGFADTIATGEFALRNCRVDVVSGKVIEGADGVIPLSLFAHFLLRLDMPHRTLELIPYPATANAQPPRGLDLLLARATLNGRHEGYVLLDTGSSYTAVSREVARPMRSALSSLLQMRAASGAVTGEMIPSPVRFEVGGRSLVADHVVAMNLAEMSRHNGVNVIGVLGFPDLHTSVLTVNYRDAEIRFHGN